MRKGIALAVFPLAIGAAIACDADLRDLRDGGAADAAGGGRGGSAGTGGAGGAGGADGGGGGSYVPCSDPVTSAGCMSGMKCSLSCLEKRLICRPAGGGAQGASCTADAQCAAGHTCLESRCVRYCRSHVATDCPSPTRCSGGIICQGDPSGTANRATYCK